MYLIAFLQLWEAQRELAESLTLGGEVRLRNKNNVKIRQLQAMIAVELLAVDKEQGSKCLRLWKEGSEGSVRIRSLDFTKLDDYLSFRTVEAGCR